MEEIENKEAMIDIVRVPIEKEKNLVINIHLN